MIAKIPSILLLITYVVTAEEVPTSYASFNDYHNTVKHIQSLYGKKPEPVQYSYSQPSHANLQYSRTPSSLYNPYSSLASSHQVPNIKYTNSPVPSYNSQSSAGLGTYAKQYGTALDSDAGQYSEGYGSHGIQYSVPTQQYQYSGPSQQTIKYITPQAPQYSSHHHEEEHTHPKYEFSYGVEDHHSGDIHSHKESRDGDVTQGEYSLHEADGTVRTVKYRVDKHSGFQAVVEKSGKANHPQLQPHQQKQSYY